jgi:hypothetical protein
MKKSTCPKCSFDFSNKGGNYNRHANTCDGSYKPFVKCDVCKYCSLDFSELNVSERANHTRWCLENPKRSTYYSGDCKQMHTKEAIAKRTIGIKKAHADGKYDHVNRKGKTLGFKHSAATKAVMSQKALASKHRRLVRSIREYKRKDGTIVMLDSSWEESLARRLDEIDVTWVRPEHPISYVGFDGKEHNYFPDFYLPNFDLYLDPKNPIAVIAQKDKLECLKKVLNNLVVIESLEECINFVPQDHGK